MQTVRFEKIHTVKVWGLPPAHGTTRDWLTDGAMIALFAVLFGGGMWGGLP